MITGVSSLLPHSSSCNPCYRTYARSRLVGTRGLGGHAYVVFLLFYKKMKNVSQFRQLRLLLILYRANARCPNICMYRLYIIVIFFFPFGHISSCSHFCPTSGGVGTIRPSGSRCWRFGRDPCSVLRVASLLNFFGLGHT